MHQAQGLGKNTYNCIKCGPSTGTTIFNYKVILNRIC
jgi:hypothetical protein